MKVPSERVSLQLGGYPSNEPATGVCVRTYPTPGRSLLCYREKQAKVRRRPASHFEIGGLLAKRDVHGKLRSNRLSCQARHRRFPLARSEERRVGKECRSRSSQYH